MSDRAFIATRKGLFTLSRTPAGWTIVNAAFVGDTLTIVLPDRRDDHIYVAVGHGHFGAKVHRSNNGGVTWEEVATPTYPPLREGEEPVQDPMRKVPVPQSLQMIWALEAGGPDQHGVLWCGTVPGGLFRSTDRGTSWDFVRSLWDNPARKQWFGGGLDWPGIHSVCVDPRDSKRVTVGVSCGGVWFTPDSGQTWECRATGMRAEYMPPEQANEPAIQDPHRITRCAAQPDKLWAQHHNGIFRTTDNARSWTEIKSAQPSAFGFAVAVHPKDGDTAWFVPAIKDDRRVPIDGRLVVTRTTDGGKTFDILRKGLPQEHAYDLVYRHALDIDDSGDKLIFGSTTGSLWLSEDQGDTWQTISTHLPPINCVRFANRSV